MTEGQGNRTHGGYRDGSNTHAVLDLSTCVDAFGIFAPITRALELVTTRAAYRDYPDPTSELARRSLASLCDVDPTTVDVGPGAAEIIWTVVRTCVRPGQRVLQWEPCFSEFSHAALAQGATITSHIQSSELVDVEARLHAFSESVRACAPALAYLCAPSSPRGEWFPAEALSNVASAHQDTLFLIDQSYLNMSFHASEREVRFPPNTILLRSITKELGLPGVRAGYALMNAALRTTLSRHRPHWVLGTHAQAVLQAYASCQSLVAERRQLMLQQALMLSRELSTLGWQPQPSDTPYFTLAAPMAAPVAASEITRLLFERDAIAVRDCTSFGLPNHIRVVAHPGQARLIRALTSFGSR